MAPKMPKEYSDLRKQQILTAAWECFADKGYEKTTIRDIAKALNLSTGTIYTYFKSKDEMLEALNTWSMEQKNTLFNKIAQKKTTHDAVEELFSQVFECCSIVELRKNNSANINFWAEAMKRENIREFMNSHYRMLQENISGFFRKGIEQGELNDDIEPGAIANFYIALMLGMQVQSTLLDEADGESFLKEVKRLMVTNIWRNGSNEDVE